MAKEHPFEPLVESFSEKLVALVESIPEQEMPFGAIELTAEEQLDHYRSIRENPQAFLKLIQERAGADFPSIPREVVDYVLAMEAQISKRAKAE